VYNRHCLICDDHPMVREAMAGTVHMTWPDAHVVEVGDFPGAWTAASEQPELCIADLMMPGASPLAGIDGLIRAAPQMKVLIVTGTQDDALLLALLDRGVAGFAPKTSNGAVIEAALRLVYAGGRYLPPRLAEIASSRVATAMVKPLRDPGALLAERLSERQMAVLRLVAEGQSNKEIARLLNLSPATVKTHLSTVFAALGALNRTDAAIKARELRIT